jgi:hypothetical protein
MGLGLVYGWMELLEGGEWGIASNDGLSFACFS